jgi:hypothetical protein
LLPFPVARRFSRKTTFRCLRFFSLSPNRTNNNRLQVVYIYGATQGYNNVVADSLSAADVGGSASCLLQVEEAFTELGTQLLAGAAAQRTLEALFNVCDPTLNPLESTVNQNEFTMDLANLFPVQENDPSCTDPLCNIAKVSCYPEHCVPLSLAEPHFL